MASFQEAMQKVPTYLTSKYDKQVSDAFMSYIEEEEIDEIDVIINDITSSSSQSSIIEYVSNTFNWNKSQQQSFYLSLRILFELDREKPQISIKLPTEINWTNFTISECQKTREYINKQCYNSFSNYDQSFITIETIGRNHNINIIPLLFDIYSYYKYKKIGNNMTHAQFCAKSKVLQQIAYKDDEHKKIYDSLVQALSSFEYRMIPKFNVNNYIKIDDDINAFIEYTLNISNMLHKIITVNHSCLPLLVDLWIIPSNVKEALNVSTDADGNDSDSDEDDDDEDDDDDVKEDRLPLHFEANLKKYGAVFEVESVDYKEEAKCQRILKTVFQKILNKSRRSIKICIIIDRRKNDNNLLIYQLPLKYSAIPRNYCNETLIYSSSEHLMYDIDNSILKQRMNANTDKEEDKEKDKEKDKEPIFGARFDCDGKMFCLSFALHETNRNRIQFWRNGGGLRFWPNYMLSVWPKLFINGKIDNKYLQNDYIKNRFSLNVMDKVFDEWYNCLVDK